MTAEEKGMEMMQVPMRVLPPLAIRFADKLCSEGGACMEVILTAFTVYAQCVEGLPCSDNLYKARDQDIEWFETHKTI